MSKALSIKLKDKPLSASPEALIGSPTTKIAIAQTGFPDIYKAKFTWPHISTESIPDARYGKTVYIETERFTAESLYSSRKTFDTFEDDIQKLYSVTFGDKEVMASFADGSVKTKEQFESTVNLQSLRWNHGYSFAGFIIKDNATDAVVGYEVIGNSGIRNQAEMAYLFSKAYHRSDKVKDVGYENVGALCLEYGRNLYNSKSVVNQSFNQDKAEFEGGDLFTSITATARDDNPGSYKILEKLGFFYKEDSFKFGHNRHVYDKLYIIDDIVSSYLEGPLEEPVSNTNLVGEES